MQFTRDELTELKGKPNSTKLCWADFYNAKLADFDMSQAVVYGSEFYGADLSNANLSNTNLSNVNFKNANLSNSNMNGAFLSEAKFHGADLSGADLSNAKMSGANLNQAKYDKDTKWPLGFDAQASGAILEKAS